MTNQMKDFFYIPGSPRITRYENYCGMVWHGMVITVL